MTTAAFQIYACFLPLALLSSPTTYALVISPADLSALRAVRAALKDSPGASSDFFSTWDFTADPCSTFSGVTCSPDPLSPSTLRVSALTLGTGRSDSPGLSGSLSSSISILTHLAQLILAPGRVSGPIPPHIGGLRNLRVLSLTRNALTGRIPDSLSGLTNLHTLDLSCNRLEGSIPNGVMTLPQLKVLILSSNRLSGDLPPLPTGLLHLDLRNNRIGGTLIRPVSTAPSSLRYLSLSNNVMWGPLDDGLFQSLSELVFLDLSMNRFNGQLPPSVFIPPSLFLQRNCFDGQLPTTFPASTRYFFFLSPYS